MSIDLFILVIILCIIIAILGIDAIWGVLVVILGGASYLLMQNMRCKKSKSVAFKSNTVESDAGLDQESNYDLGMRIAEADTSYDPGYDVDDAIALKGQHMTSMAKRSELIQAKATVQTFEKWFTDELNNTESMPWWENNKLDIEM